MTKTASNIKVHVVASDDERPLLRVEPGKRYEVTVASVVDSDLRVVKEETEGGTTLRPARLCGSRSTCVAIVEVE